MADAKKPAAPKPIVDVARPGQSAPSATSKPVIVTNRPILKDPMMADGDTPPAAESPADTQADKPAAKLTIQPPASDTPAASPVPDAAPSKDAAKPDDAKPTDSIPDEPADQTGSMDPSVTNEATAKTNAEQVDAAAEQQAKHEADIENLVETKQYFLPINAVGQRRTKRFIVLGVVVSVLLALAWVNIALDAGLIKLGGIKPVTHFFSN